MTVQNAGVGRTKRFGGQRGGVQTSVLTETDILDAAVEVIRSAGLDALTVTKVAEALGVTGPAVYYHVRGGRTGLASMVAASIMKREFADQLVRRPDEEWDDAIERVLLVTADLTEEFPGVVNYVLNAQHGRVEDVGVASFVVAQLRAGGFGPGASAEAYTAICALIAGWAQLTPFSLPQDEPPSPELAEAIAASSAVSPRDHLRAAVQALLTGLRIRLVESRD
ncbi:TetR/AcrR family transcriptional regulator [Mycobacterium sp.]|uniref:TetR/AcrR family transcriptional regulator n=1 Tax=Mycobacterium sp. TaxID=1785 RepID=UPI003F9AEE18